MTACALVMGAAQATAGTVVIDGAAAKVLSATWQRCRVSFQNHALAHAGRFDRRVDSAFIATAFAQDDAGAARQQWRRVARRPKVPTLATLMDESEADVLASMTFPAQHRAKLHASEALERLDGEIKRRTEVVVTLPQRSGRHMARRRHPARAERRMGRATRPLHDAGSIAPIGDNPLVSLPTLAA